MQVKNKVMVITGGSSGLGLALAKHYGKQGAKLALLARDQKKLEEAKRQVSAQNSTAIVETFSVDISNSESVKTVVKDIVEKFGSIDVLINSAGILVEGYFENTPLEDFERVMNTNFLALVNMTHETLPYLKKSKGRIINIASVASFFGAFAISSYCASKFAVLGFSEALRTELTPQGIRIHVVCPPEFEGPMVDGIDEGRTPENRYLVKTAGTLTVEQVLRGAVRGIEKNQFIILIDLRSKAMVLLNRLLPDVVRLFTDLTIKRIYVGPR
jgi:3-dehydrosphinganine reductase